jgi:hypothetical protein
MLRGALGLVPLQLRGVGRLLRLPEGLNIVHLG